MGSAGNSAQKSMLRMEKEMTIGNHAPAAEPAPITPEEFEELHSRGLAYAQTCLAAFEEGLYQLVSAAGVTEPPRPADTADTADPAATEVDGARVFWRYVDQTKNVAALLVRSIEQVVVYANEPLAWILLETAARQFGFAAGTVSQLRGVVGHTEDEVHAEALTMMLRKELVVEPRSIVEVVDLGAGPGAVPDMRPAAVYDSMALQSYAFAAAVCASIPTSACGPYPRRAIARMAYREILARIVDESAELLAAVASDLGFREVAVEAGRADDAVDALWHSGPDPEVMFRGGEGVVDAA